MRRLVLDAGPLIALFSDKDDYHEVGKAGFAQLPTVFGEVLTPLPILFEVYKFVAREQSPHVAQKALSVICDDTLVVPLEMKAFQHIYRMVYQMPKWKSDQPVELLHCLCYLGRRVSVNNTGKNQVLGFVGQCRRAASAGHGIP